MGNEAIITTAGGSTGIYLHWNGGHDSVTAFLRYAELAGLPGAKDDGRWIAPFTAMLVNFFGNNGLNVSIVPVRPLRPELSSPGCNGVYLIEGHQIARRIDAPEHEQRGHDLDEMLRGIDAKQPAADRLGAFLVGVEVEAETLKVGDLVWKRDHFGKGPKYRLCTVLGHGKPGQLVNGTRRGGHPYVDWFEGQDNAKNPNSYLQGTVRIPSAG